MSNTISHKLSLASKFTLFLNFTHIQLKCIFAVNIFLSGNKEHSFGQTKFYYHMKEDTNSWYKYKVCSSLHQKFSRRKTV